MKSPMNGWRNAIAGFLIGVGCVLPGVSGGVMAMSFGLYLPMLDAALHFFRHPFEKLRFLIPLGIGGAAGIAAGAKLLSTLMEKHESLMLFLFIGFILGGLPQLYAEAVKKEAFQKRWLWSFLGGLLLALPLVLISGRGEPVSALKPVQIFLTGLMEGVGTVVPGVSTSFVLIRLGWYQAYLDLIAAMHPGALCLMGAGFALSALLCMKTIQWLFAHMPGRAYCAVTGFLLASAAAVFPGFHQPPLLWADGGMLIIGTVCSYWLGRIESQKE